MKKIIITILSVLIFCPCVISAETVKTKLPNGQTVIVKEVHENPTVIVDTWIRTGSIDENDENNGVAHFLEHLFFRGSENYPDKEFDKILESKGAITNAATSKDFTHYYILIPSKDFETAVKLQADMLTKPLIPQNGLEQERNVVIREIEKGNDSPRRKLFHNFGKAFYKNSPYRRDVIGTKEIISKIPREKILDFYYTNYVPSNMYTVIAGDVNAKEAVKIVKKYFDTSCRKSNSVKNKKYPQDKKPDKKTEVKDSAEVNTTYFLTGFKGPKSVKDRESFALDIAADILGGGKSSRLYKSLKDKNELVRGISSFNSGNREDTVFYISANFEPANIGLVKKEIEKEIKNLKDGVTEEEVAKSKKQAKKETLYSRETISGIASEMGYCAILTKDLNFYDRYLNELEKVTVKDVNKAVNKYIDVNHSVTSVVEPKAFSEKISNENSVKADKEGVSSACSSEFVKFQKHSPKSTEKVGKVVKYTLDNGAVLVTDKHKNNEIIAVSIKVKGGNFTEPEKGVNSIIAKAMIQGTKKYPKELFNEISEENGIYIVPGSGNETFSVFAKCIKSDLPQMKDMLNEVINNALLDSSSIKKAKAEILYDIKANRDNPSNAAIEELNTELWKNTPYGLTGKVLEKTIPQISEETVRKQYENLFYPQNIVISVNGNVNDAEMIDCFSEIFKAKEGKAVNYKDYDKLFPELDKNKIITTERESESAWIYISWLTDGKADTKDRMALNVINSILGSGMSSRLFYEIRDKQGLAYAIGSGFSAGVNKGSFTLFIGTDPKKSDKAEEALMKEIERIKSSYVSEKELEDAKNKLKGHYILSLETNGDKAENYAVSEVSGDGCDFPNKIFELIDKVNVNDVINAANKYFSKHYIVSRVLPKK